MKISVCIATYNGSKYIKEQLDSILIQLGENDEVIVSDDSSSDNTIEIIKSLVDKRIQIFEGQVFHNHTLNFEFALAQSTGDYIFLSDQDDVWMPDKVKIMINLLKEYNLVVSDCLVVNEFLKPLPFSLFNGKFNHSGFINNIIKNHFLGCCMAFDRRILDLSLPFPSGVLSHESWLGAVAEAFGKTKFSSDKLIMFRRHNSNHSNTLKGSTLNLKEKVTYRMVIVANIIKLKINFKKIYVPYLLICFIFFMAFLLVL